MTRTRDVLRQWLVPPRGFVDRGSPYVAFEYAQEFVALLRARSWPIIGFEGWTWGGGPGLLDGTPLPSDQLGLSLDHIATFTMDDPVQDRQWAQETLDAAQRILTEFEADPPVLVQFTLTHDI